jgi:hypothetical protein
MSVSRFGAAILLAVPCLALAACGSSHGPRGATTAGSAPPPLAANAPPIETAPPTAANAPHLDADEDYDDASGKHYDLDDYEILHFGQAASPAEAAAIAALVRNYYAYAAARDGKDACKLVFSVVAESLPEQYGVKTYGRSCASVASKLFRLKHSVYVERHATLQFLGARVEGQHGFALLRFNAKNAYDEHLRLRREGNRWTLHQLLDEGLP